VGIDAQWLGDDVQDQIGVWGNVSGESAMALRQPVIHRLWLNGQPCGWCSSGYVWRTGHRSQSRR